MDDKPSNAVSPYPTTRPPAYDANTPPKITTTQKPGAWPGTERPQIGGWPGGPGLKGGDPGAATKRAGMAKAEASNRQGAVEQGYGSARAPEPGARIPTARRIDAMAKQWKSRATPRPSRPPPDQGRPRTSRRNTPPMSNL